MSSVEWDLRPGEPPRLRRTVERKRAYRYAVIEHGGAGTKAVGDSPFMLDWKYLGRTYTWNIVGGLRVESSGFITGRYLDKGWLVDGEYVTDAGGAA